MKTETANTSHTKKILTQAFWDLYKLKKIEHITIKEITSKAGYHRSTFYLYFVDIYDVLNQLEEALLEYLKEQVMSSLENGPNEDITQKLANIYETKGDYFGTLLGENGDPFFSQKMKAVMLPALSNAFGLTEKETHAAYIFEFGLSALIGTLTYWYNNQREIPSQEMVKLTQSMLATGLLPEIQKHSNRTISNSW